MSELIEGLFGTDALKMLGGLIPILVTLLIVLIAIKVIMKVVKKAIEKSKIEKGLHSFETSKVFIAFIRPIVPIDMRSSIPHDAFSNFFAM